LPRSIKSSSRHCWSKVDARRFNVRGKTYMQDGKKVKAGSGEFELIGVDVFATAGRNEHIAMWPMSTFQRMKRNAIREGTSMPFVLIINWVVPGTPRYNQVNYFARKAPPHLDSKAPDDEQYERLLHHFLTGPDKFRDRRFKLIPSVEEGPWLVKKGVGNTPAIVGGKLKQLYFQGDGYMEIDVDVGSSAVVGPILKLCKQAAEKLVMDLAFVIEGKREEELPERILGAVRLHHVSLPKLEMEGDPTTGLPFTAESCYEE